MTTEPPEYPGNREPYRPYHDPPITPGSPLPGPAYASYNQPGYDDPVPGPAPYVPAPHAQPYTQLLSPQAVPSAGVNGFAVASFILSFCVGGLLLLSIIFGLVGLRQIERNGQSGRGYAIAGLLISVLWILAIAGAVFYTEYQEAKRDLTGNVTAEGNVAITDLKAGDCIKSLQLPDVLFTVTAVPCNQAHEGEVAGEFIIGGTIYPGEEGVTAQAAEKCEPIVREYTSPATLAKVSDIYFLGPRETDWNKGRKTVTCVAMTAATQIGSVKG
ncbi:hypothetical protein Rhe02_25860 [Rhizocola hellebori]|uniref:DUF4190 domain-containing protein n=1 Tax=Rhizocola hellebori TaxID=1392758 RepID=A0A8J3Q6X0_9ACTN|nr:DUF4190 domain-containing protein [Rhizocola hellebori]GIH04519.1 hypothetical protein Rhe02_25860 [Rhizocola hellebori]